MSWSLKIGWIFQDRGEGSHFRLRKQDVPSHRSVKKSGGFKEHEQFFEARLYDSFRSGETVGGKDEVGRKNDERKYMVSPFCIRI